MRLPPRFLGHLLLGAALAVSPAPAEETTAEPHGKTEAAHGDLDFHRNHFMGIVAWSHKDTDKDSVTLGMDYLRYFTRRIGLSAFIELSEGQFKADTAGFTLLGKPTKHLSLFAGPGIERTLFDEKERLLRAGLGYSFHPKGVIVKPMAWVDFVAGHKIYNLGVGIGKGF